jgi:hypothetical protein
MIAIPNHHFFQWVNQLKESGYEVYWFDSTDGGNKVDRIDWVYQIKGWKLKYNYPLRHFFKNFLLQRRNFGPFFRKKKYIF